MEREGNSAIFQKDFSPYICVLRESHHPLGKMIDFCLPTLYYPPLKEVVENTEVWDFGGPTRNSGAGSSSKRGSTINQRRG